MNNGDIIKGIKKKNQRALEAAFDLYGNLVFKVVSSVLEDTYERGDVEDCVNEIFLSLWNNIDCYNDDKATFKTWLVAVSKYKALDYKRVMRKTKAHENVEDIPIACNISTEDFIIGIESKKEVMNIINNLKDKDKEIFIRRFLLDESVESIAEKLGISRDVVYNRMSRGRKVIKEKYYVAEESV